MAKIRMNPLTRVHGYMSVEVDIQDGVVTDAWSSGLLFRGFEAILKGRSPHDAVYLTQRICGICSSAHAIAASLALENAFGIEVPHNGLILRNLIFGADLVQNHIRQLYLMAIPDYIKSPPNAPGQRVRDGDFRLPQLIETRMQENYLTALETSHKAHKAVATFGGKAPHLQSILAGGVTEQVLTDRIMRFVALIGELETFVREKLIPDIEDIARYYDDYFTIGQGYGNMLSYGLFPLDAGGQQFVYKPGLVRGREIHNDYEPDKIVQDIRYAWYTGKEEPAHPLDAESSPSPKKSDAYSWIKAPRYGDEPFESGPLARMWLAGVYQNGISVMDRLMARAIETKEVAGQLVDWTKELVPDRPTISWVDPLPFDGEGAGFIDSMRGTLAHWVRVRNRRIDAYRIITPSAWNLSPRDYSGTRGPLEEALVGTPVADEENPQEVGRVVRSYDPCISCAVHVLQKDGTSRPWRQL